jgi:hypothetical protein
VFGRQAEEFWLSRLQLDAGTIGSEGSAATALVIHADGNFTPTTGHHD